MAIELVGLWRKTRDPDEKRGGDAHWQIYITMTGIQGPRMLGYGDLKPEV